MKAGFKLEGGRDMERALADLKRSTSRAVARRAVQRTLGPVRDTADAYSADFQIVIGSRLTGRERRRARSDFAGSVVSLFVGPVAQDGSHAPEASFTEFGTPPRYHESGKYTGFILPDPFMRPAWDMHRDKLLPRLGGYIWEDIEETVARSVAKAKREAGK